MRAPRSASGLLALLSALVVGLAPFAVAQGGPEADGLLEAMRDAYGRLDYDTAEQRAREALARYEALSPDELVEVHTTLGILLHARNRPLEARRQFEAALSLDPGLGLDPLLVSPKTLEFFEEVRGSVSAPAEEGGVTPAIRYVRVPDPRSAAALRSLALPGWGQLHKGEQVKGWALVGLWAAAAGGSVAAHLARQAAEDDYLAARDPAEIAARYDTFDRWHRARGALALGAAAVWGYAVLDALVVGGPQEPIQVTPTATGVALRVRL